LFFFAKKVLLKSIEYFWAPKVLPIPVSILSGKHMGLTSTNTIKVFQHFIAHTFYSILTTLAKTDAKI